MMVENLTAIYYINTPFLIYVYIYLTIYHVISAEFVVRHSFSLSVLIFLLFVSRNANLMCVIIYKGISEKFLQV